MNLRCSLLASKLDELETEAMPNQSYCPVSFVPAARRADFMGIRRGLIKRLSGCSFPANSIAASLSRETRDYVVAEMRLELLESMEEVILFCVDR